MPRRRTPSKPKRKPSVRKRTQPQRTRYRDPDTGHYVSRETYLRIMADERADFDDWDDFEDFDEFDEEEYLGEG